MRMPPPRRMASAAAGRRLDPTGTRHHRAHPGQPEEEGVEQGEDGLVLPPLTPPCGQQHGEVRGHLAARVVPHHEERALLAGAARIPAPRSGSRRRSARAPVGRNGGRPDPATTPPGRHHCRRLPHPATMHLGGDAVDRADGRRSAPRPAGTGRPVGRPRRRRSGTSTIGPCRSSGWTTPGDHPVATGDDAARRRRGPGRPPPAGRPRGRRGAPARVPGRGGLPRSSSWPPAPTARRPPAGS